MLILSIKLIKMLYCRIYYTLYRMLLRFGEDEVPRINATLIMSLLFGLNATAVFTLVSVIAKEDIIIGSRAHSMILAGLIIGLNFYIIFLRNGT